MAKCVCVWQNGSKKCNVPCNGRETKDEHLTVWREKKEKKEPVLPDLYLYVDNNQDANTICDGLTTLSYQLLFIMDYYL